MPIYDTVSANVFNEKIMGYGFKQDGDNLTVPDRDKLSIMVDVNNGSHIGEEK